MGVASRLKLLGLVSGFGLLFVAPDAAAEPVAVNPFGDAEGEIAAVSLMGNATCTAEGCVAVSAEQDATSNGTSVSAMGDATQHQDSCLFGCIGPCALVSISATGQSTSCFVAASGNGDANGQYVAVSGTGNATSICFDWCGPPGGVAASLTGAACGSFVGVSVTGPADCFGLVEASLCNVDPTFCRPFEPTLR